MSNLLQYTPQWEKAMRCGLIGGRPFSEACIKNYTFYLTGFLKQHDGLTMDSVKELMMTVPIEHFSKRLKIYESIRCFTRYLIENEMPLPKAFDPLFLEKIQRYKPKRHTPPRKITVSEENIEKLLSVCDTALDTIIVELLSQTGLRVTEACNLTLSDLNLEKGYLTVKLAKWGKTRRVGLTQRVQQAIQIYLKHRPNHESQQLMITNKGYPIVRYGVRTRLAKLGHRTKISVSPHALRRAFVTINANKGRPLPMLQIACGHSDITTTRSYCMTTEDETIEAMNNWD